MATNKKRPRRSQALIAKLADLPMFSQYVQTMPTHALQGLVQHVGRTDSQPLIELATPDQLRELIALDVWKSPAPGEAEQFDPYSLLEWMEVWEEASTEFLVAKILDLDSELIAGLLIEFVSVVDISEVGVERDDAEVFGEFAVLPLPDGQWERLYRLLVQIWDHSPSLLTEILARCCARRSLASETAGLVSPDSTLRSDLAGDHEQTQMERGFVGGLNAAMLLTDAKDKDLSELLTEEELDVTSKRHLTRSGQGQAASPVVSAEIKQDEPQLLMPGSSQTAVGVTEEVVGEQWDEIETLLAEVNVPSSSFQATADASVDQAYLEQLLRRLGNENPTSFANRQNEVAYIANALFVGTTFQGQQFTRAQAGKAVSAICNLALSYCRDEQNWTDRTVFTKYFVNDEPGLVAVFRIGYSILARVSAGNNTVLKAALQSRGILHRLRGQNWILEMLKEVYNEPDNGASPSQVRNLLEVLETVLDRSTCAAMNILCDPFPCYPNLLDETTSKIYVDTTYRFIDSLEDVVRISSYLKQLKW